MTSTPRDLREIAIVIDLAHREGEGRDYPEGKVYLTMSDTLARKLVKVLREAADNLEARG
jgi:hypothetical protein